MNIMELKIDLTRGDFADFNRYYWWRYRKWHTVFCTLLLASYTLWNVSRGSRWDTLSWIVGGILVVSGLLTFMFFFMFFVIEFSARSMPSKTGSGILGPKVYVFSPEEIRYTAVGSNTQVKWSGIMAFGKSRRSYFLHLDRNAALIIPRRFLTEENEAEFLGIVQLCLKPLS